jgi:putative SOS response-associated peptidase YedK
MCGRFSLTTERPDLIREFEIAEDRMVREWSPRYNLAPTQPVPVLLDENGPTIALFRWGLIPTGAKDPRVGSRMINARRETLAERPACREAFRRRRCLVLADGFYEWRDDGSGRPKVPHYIRLRSRRPFTFAGLWSPWNSPSEGWIRTVTVVTGEPNSLVRDVHDRMPVILPPENRDAWLSPDNEDEVALDAILRSFPPTEMEMFPVSRFVNSVAHEGPSCIDPAPDPQPSLFPLDTETDPRRHDE